MAGEVARPEPARRDGQPAAVAPAAGRGWLARGRGDEAARPVRAELRRWRQLRSRPPGYGVLPCAGGGSGPRFRPKPMINSVSLPGWSSGI